MSSSYYISFYQVDFLNDQLAVREKQLSEASIQIAEARESREEMDYRSTLAQ